MSVSNVIKFPVLVIVNGKCYSPSSFPPATAHQPPQLRFTLSLHHEPASGAPELKLHMLAPRDMWPALNPVHIQDHAVSFFFSAKGLFNYKHLGAPGEKAAITRFGVPAGEVEKTEMKVKSAAAGDRDRDGDGVSPWRILEFAAEEMAVDAGAIEVVPRLRTEEMEALVKRLVATVKHAIETPTAVLEVKCLIYDADASTDDALSALEEALNSPPRTPPPAALSPSKRSPITTWRHLKTRYQDARDAKPSLQSSNSSSAINNRDAVPNSAVEPPSTPSRSPSRSPEKNMFQNNSPPTLRFLTPGKRVCFNCYDVGHREDVCVKPKRLLGNRQPLKKTEKRKGGKKGGHGGLVTGSSAVGADDDDVFVENRGSDVDNGERDGGKKHTKQAAKDAVVKEAALA